MTQLANAVRHLWQWPAPELGLRTTTDLLLANVMLLRAGNRVDIELRDMISRHRLAVLALGRPHAVGKDQQDWEGPAAGRRGPLSLLAIVSVLYSACLLGHWQIPPLIFKLSFVVLPGCVCICTVRRLNVNPPFTLSSVLIFYPLKTIG